MQWSKLRTQVEALFADSVQGRVRLHSTRYRRMHDQEGRAWITLDGQEIINMPHVFKWWDERDQRAAELAGVEHKAQNWQDWIHKCPDAAKQIAAESIFSQGELGRAMRQYVNLSMDEILNHENALIRSIGMLDRRLGKRRLAEMDAGSMHPLLRTLYRFRCDAEGLESAAAVAQIPV